MPGEGGEGGLKIEVKENGITLDTEEEISITSNNANISLKASARDINIEAKHDHSVTVDGETWEEKTEESREEIHGDSGLDGPDFPRLLDEVTRRD